MRSLPLLALALSLSACDRGPLMTVTFTGPAALDHEKAAGILTARLAKLGNVKSTDVQAGGTIVIKGHFKGADEVLLDRVGRPGQLSFHVVGDDAAAQLSVEPPAKLVMRPLRRPDGRTAMATSLCAPDLAELGKAMAANARQDSIWIRESAAGDPCALLLSHAKLSEVDIASARVDESTGRGASLNVAFTSTGAEIFSALTEQIVGQRMAIVVDGTISSAPVVQSAITGGRAEINFGTGPGRAASDSRGFALTIGTGRLPARYRVSVAR